MLVFVWGKPTNPWVLSYLCESIVLGGLAVLPKKANALKCQTPTLYLELVEVKLIETTSEEDIENLVILEETNWPDSFVMEYSGPESFQLRYLVEEAPIYIGLGGE